MKTNLFPIIFRYLLITGIIFTFSGAKAQDTLIYNDSHIRIVKLLEVGLDEIKFRELQDSSEIIRSIDREELKEIKCASKEKITILKDPMIARFTEKELKRNNAIKFAVFSPIFNNLSFSYERVIHPWLNYQGTLCLIGVGHHQENQDASGFALRNGVRFFHKPAYRQRGVGMFHPLHGKYIEFEFVFSNYTKTWVEEEEEFSWFGPSYSYEIYHKAKFTNYVFNINFGHQYLLDSGILLDMYFGVGMGGQISNSKTSGLYDDSESEDYTPYTHVWGGKNLPMTFTTGLRIGGIFR